MIIAHVTAIITKAVQKLEDDWDQNIDNLSKLDRPVPDLQKVKKVKVY